MRVEQSAVAQIGDERGDRADRSAAERFLTRSKLSWWVSQPPRADLDEGHADLDEPAGQQAAVAEAAAAVLLRLAAGSAERSKAFASFDCISVTARS